MSGRTLVKEARRKRASREFAAPSLAALGRLALRLMNSREVDLRSAPLATRSIWPLCAVGAVLALSACGGSDAAVGGSAIQAGSGVASGSSTGTTMSGTTTTGTTAGTTTTGTTAGTTTTGTTTSTSVTSSSVASVQLASIPSNFDINSELVPAWGTGEVPGTAAPDNVGAFRFICTAGQVLADDPIVYPGQPGRSHLHQFFGNTGANANSTYASLRTTGDSTCTSKLNRSAYWIPAMLNGKGQVVRPDYISIYYKRYPANSPECTRQGIGCVPLPRGLRFIFGYNMLNNQSPPTGELFFNCQGTGAVSGSYPSIVEAAANCPVGAQLGAIIAAPNCWDGRNLDSPDHRAHVAYASYGDWGYLKCPATHPYVIPTFQLGAWYTTDSDLDRSGRWSGTLSGWRFASDEMVGGAKPGSTFHADWWGAWDDTVMQMWTDNCINRLLNCSGGDLGNGRQMKSFEGFTFTASPRLIPVPK